MKHLNGICFSLFPFYSRSFAKKITTKLWQKRKSQEWGQEAAKSRIIIISSDNNRLVGNNFPVNLISADFSSLLLFISPQQTPPHSHPVSRGLLSLPLSIVCSTVGLLNWHKMGRYVSHWTASSSATFIHNILYLSDLLKLLLFFWRTTIPDSRHKLSSCSTATDSKCE